ncbi:MAG: hypothetical protein JNJ43_09880 [Anaerolineales bacterium]|nr:hypothetical protein [Anaerolineales bacterium]
MIETFLNLEPSIQSIIISALVGFLSGILGAYFKYFLDKKALRDKIQIEHEYSERKKLRELVGRYHGRILEDTERLNHRLWNLQQNENKGWLDMDGNFSQPESNYYFTTTAYRTISLFTLIRLFEQEAIFIDSRIAKEGELLFQKFIKAFEWVLTDVDLFRGLEYETFRQKDHLFRDKLRLLCDSCITEGKVISLEDFQERLKTDEGQNYLKPILTFFDGLCSGEKRLRWDRLISFHLLLMVFINKFGYDVQKSSKGQILEIAKSIKNPQVLMNLVNWLSRLGLGKETKYIVNVTNSIVSNR